MEESGDNREEGNKKQRIDTRTDAGAVCATSSSGPSLKVNHLLQSLKHQRSRDSHDISKMTIFFMLMIVPIELIR